MILEELVLHNFGVYRGRQMVSLAPTDGRPIILIGGLNGGGKTSLLDALQLALYGRLSRTSNRGELAYDDYLRRCIHRGVPPTAGAAVELQFSHTSAGTTHRYRIHRSWRVTKGDSIREHVEVLCDGSPDALLAEAWDEQVEAFLPARLAPLFFFDGEKIEGLADPQSSKAVLTTALQGLLGLDVIRRLDVDLLALERRRRQEAIAVERQGVVEQARKAVEEAHQARSTALDSVGEARNALDQARRDLARAEEQYQAAGGSLHEQRQELEAALILARRELQNVEDELRRLAVGAAPLLLVRPMLEQASAAATRTEEARWNAKLVAELERRDAVVLGLLEDSAASTETRALLQSALEADRARRVSGTGAAENFPLSEEQRHVLSALLHEVLPSTAGAVKDLLAAHAEAADARDLAERRLAAVPEGDAIQPLLQARDAARVACSTAESAFASAVDAHEAAKRLVEEREQALERTLIAFSDEQLAAEHNRRLIDHARRVRGTLERFSTELLVRRAAHISRLVYESFQTLTRKQELVREITIDPVTYELRLTAGDGSALSPERLSAGERQLLAISILWGLARAAGRPLPAIIDTPLGRLDSVHREHLVSRYFPAASHQVILLSTDEEIDADLYARLAAAVTRSYLLQHEPTGYTRVEPGYFWN